MSQLLLPLEESLSYINELQKDWEAEDRLSEPSVTAEEAAAEYRQETWAQLVIREKLGTTLSTEFTNAEVELGEYCVIDAQIKVPISAINRLKLESSNLR